VVELRRCVGRAEESFTAADVALIPTIASRTSAFSRIVIDRSATRAPPVGI
jgi:hypothetical protein